MVGNWYREGEAEDFLYEVGGRDGAKDSLDAVLLLLHVGLLVELIDGKMENNQAFEKNKTKPTRVTDERLDSTC